MIIKNIEDNNDDGIKLHRAMSPFGPLMIQGNISKELQSTILTELDSILKLPGESNIIHGKYGGGAQAKSIKSGKFKNIDLDNNNIITDTIKGLTERYWYIMAENISHINNGVWEKMNNSSRSITSAWIVEMKANDFHIAHDHVAEGAMIAGSLYVDIPDVPSPEGDICWTLSMPGFDIKSDLFVHSPKNGDFVIWPAWLQHHVYPFRKENVSRKMISFNARIDVSTENNNDK